MATNMHRGEGGGGCHPSIHIWCIQGISNRCARWIATSKNLRGEKPY